MAAHAVLATYIVSLCYASAHGFSLMHRRTALSKQLPTIADVHKLMIEHPSDLFTQLTGCSILHAIAAQDREGPGPFGGQRIATKHLDAGIGEAFAQGALNIRSNALAPDWNKDAAAQMCLSGINKLTVQNDYEKGLHLFTHGGPLIWKALVAFDSDPRKGPNCQYAGLYGTPQPEEAAVSLGEAGGYTMILEKLEKWTRDDAAFQGALCALSDNVNSGFRAAAQIANAGGPLHGIEVLNRVMPLTLGRHFQEGNGFGLQYEMVHDTVGLLWHDDAKHTYRNEFVRLGYIGNLMAMQKDDPMDNHLQDNCCQAIYYLTRDGNATVMSELAKVEAIAGMAKAMTTFAPRLLNEYCTVVHSCSKALVNFARASPEYLQLIRQLGVKEALTPAVMGSQVYASSRTPTWADFPGSSLVELKSLLER